MLTAGTRLGPYEIVSPVGTGAMGEVYRAHDARLGRDVAVKVLPPEFAADAERLRRFGQEARAVAALSHSNILAIHDVGTHEGAPYFVTELLDGESLRDRMRGGALPVRRAVETAVQIAQGLSAAHEKGIVHRDLKPANVFVTKDGQVKILDFGIAKLAPLRTPDEPAKVTTVVEATHAGTILGTVGYMSPEQVRGHVVDHRTDIFSFGCVLYEMISGRAPFHRDTVADTASAILTEDPRPLSGSGREIPPALQEIVNRCLEKRPEDRFSSAHDLALALKASTRGEAFRPSGRGAAAPRIAVLPFENLGSQDDTYFAAGMTEEITSRLANVQGLGVLSRTSAVQYNCKGKTIQQVGNDLGVDYVLEGTVRWDRGAGRESRVRITPQLIRVADDTHVWADRYDRVIADVFAIQSEVAENAVRAMGVALLPHEQAALREVSTSDLQAYDLYLRGQELSSRSYARKDVEGALNMYQAAGDRDPRFAQAFAGLALTCARMYWEFYDRTPDCVLKAKEAAERALELRPDLAETHAAIAYYFYYALRDYPRALDEFGAACRIQPHNSEALAGIGYVMRRQGRWAAAADAMSEALEFDAKNAAVLYMLGHTSSYARRYADADRAFEKAIALNPQWGAPHGARAWLQVGWRGDLGRAQAVLDEAGRVRGLTDETTDLAWLALRIALAQRDFPGALRQIEAGKPPAFASEGHFCPVSLLRARIQTMAGQRDPARQSYETAWVELEQKSTENPDDSRFHGSLAIAYAGLGRPLDAVREARLACELMPMSKDAVNALYRLEELAVVYAMVGQTSEAVAVLEELLKRSGDVTPHLLRLDPTWDSLREDPSFQALLTKYEVKK